MRAPGGLTDLGEQLQCWGQRVEGIVGDCRLPSAATQAGEGEDALRIADWPAVPVRVRSCLGRAQTDRLADASSERGDLGRVSFHEEYAEWRVVRDSRGPVSFELTTELPEYWELLARHTPRTFTDLVGTFARRRVGADELFGGVGEGASPAEQESRARVFRETFLSQAAADPLPSSSRFNNGVAAITCLSRPDNNLESVVRLVAESAVAMEVIDAASGRARLPSGSEAIARLGLPAQDGRYSDPLLVERVVRAATEGRTIRFDEPIGVYIADFQHHDLLDPLGQPVSGEWFTLSRQGPKLGDRLPRFQRLVVEAPEGEKRRGFGLHDLRLRRTGEQLRWGAELAELTQLAIYLRVGPRSELPAAIPSSADSSLGCDALQRRAQDLERP